jgi:transposase
LALEGHCRLHLAQARSNRGPRGRKTDFRDAQRAVSRLLSGDLILSYVPEPEQRCWRTLTRTKYQLTRDRIRLQSQLESLLEECQIKLSSVVSDLLGASGQRMLRALAEGETDPAQLAKLGDKRLRASDAELKDALSGIPQPIHRELLSLYLARLDLVESHMENLNRMIAEAMKAHQNAVVRLAELPGLGTDSAQQIIAEIGPQAAAFPSAAHWPPGSGFVLDARRVPGYRAATARPKATGPCVGFSISLLTQRFERKTVNFKLFSDAYPPAWDTPKRYGPLPTAFAG